MRQQGAQLIPPTFEPVDRNWHSRCEQHDLDVARHQTNDKIASRVTDAASTRRKNWLKIDAACCLTS
jgi:hypothetical protein